MTKTLEFAYETPQEVKVGDDETTFTLVCKNEDLPVDLTTAKLITVKIGNRSGYLRGQLISTDSLANLPTGQLKFNLDKDTLANFPTGSYCLEVWVTDAQGTSIYPSGNPLNFVVTTNIENSSGATITTITFDDFVKELNKAASTIDKGDKGDDGLSAYQVAVINGYHGSQTEWLASLVGAKGDTPDLSNYTTVTDLNNGLSTKVTDNKNGTIQVNGTQVNPYNKLTDTIGGRNYALDTGVPRTIGPSNSWQGLFSPKLSENLNGHDLVISFDLMVDAATDGQLIDQTNETTNPAWFSATSSNNQIQGIKQSGFIQLNTLTPNTPVRFAYKFKMPVWANTTQSGYVTIGLGTNSIVGGNVTISKLKIEKGTVATDWCPNPAEILTQADYAKIKAAIVALGGSLS